MFILNETEAEGMTRRTTEQEIRAAIREQFPHAGTVLTMGSQGAVYFDAEAEYRQPAYPAEAVDTTAAGDTFIGYFLAEFVQSADPARALSPGYHAASICVTRPGASDSIPHPRELDTVRGVVRDVE